MAYPFVVEPLFTLSTQVVAWSMAAMTVARVGKPSVGMTKPATLAAPAIFDRISWVVFAAIPAGLVVAVTASISTDLIAAPFLWVLPLSLYLLTFVAIFRDRPWVSRAY
jgi:hypothetical protein